MRIKPNPHYYAARLFDETPQVVLHNVVGERQRLLALVRYNRLVDRFFGAVAYSLGSWIGRVGKSQIEIDEIYVAEERHYELVPAKSVTEEDLKNYSLKASSIS